MEGEESSCVAVRVRAQPPNMVASTANRVEESVTKPRIVELGPVQVRRHSSYKSFGYKVIKIIKSKLQDLQNCSFSVIEISSF